MVATCREQNLNHLVINRCQPKVCTGFIVVVPINMNLQDLKLRFHDNTNFDDTKTARITLHNRTNNIY